MTVWEHVQKLNGESATAHAIMYLVNDREWYARFVECHAFYDDPITELSKRIRSRLRPIAKEIGFDKGAIWVDKAAYHCLLQFTDEDPKFMEYARKRFETFEAALDGDKSTPVSIAGPKNKTALALSGECPTRHVFATGKENPINAEVADRRYAITNQETENEMSNTPLHETIHMLSGRRVEDYSEEQLIEKIAELETQIEKLQKIKTHSAKIQAKITELKTAIDFVVIHLDGEPVSAAPTALDITLMGTDDSDTDKPSK